MELFFLRHGEAEQGAGFSDRERPLTAAGRDTVRRAACGMAAMGLEFDLILSSPFARALETAGVVADVLNLRGRLETAGELASGAALEEVVAEIRRRSGGLQKILVVGHEPTLGCLVALLTSGSAASAVGFKKAGLCKLRIETLTSGKCGVLEWMRTPEQLGT